MLANLSLNSAVKICVVAPNILQFRFPDSHHITMECDAACLALLSAQVTERGFDPIWVDLTSPDVHELGFYVVKAFVPGLQPLSAGYLSPQTNPVRVNQLSEYLGINWSGKILLDPPHAFP
jgi:hypothetical protein|tara:strand:+ start:1374 stop:1736 length:363 start_codon:yes stop_codon:yes gene_type:complete